ncbi:MAG: DUF4249 family protein [Bacteroidaceae bacterium]|nr:DUF4249 family protein [Bacteroidaceae bacterium]
MGTTKNTYYTRCFEVMLYACLFILSGCEKDVEFESPSEDKENNIVINALATEGEPLTVFVNYAYPIGEKPPFLSSDYWKAISMMMNT